MVVNPAEVVPFVFHGWVLVAIFVVAAPGSGWSTPPTASPRRWPAREPPQKVRGGLVVPDEHPAFDEGEELSVFVTGVEGGDPVARVGDTTLRVTGGSAELVDSRVRVRVTAFDDEAHAGEATYLETVGGSAF